MPSGLLDAPVVPMSAPDTRRLQSLVFTGLPIRLRLLIDDAGQVVEVLTLQAVDGDTENIEHIKAMLKDTAYIPGRLHGTPVGTQLDLELQFNPAH